MEDVDSMERLEAIDCLDKNTPNFVLLEQLFLLFVLENLLVQVPVICVLHYDAEFTTKSTINFYPAWILACTQWCGCFLLMLRFVPSWVHSQSTFKIGLPASLSLRHKFVGPLSFGLWKLSNMLLNLKLYHRFT